MRYSAAGNYGLDQVARDGAAAVLASRLGLLLIVLTGTFVITLTLASVRQAVLVMSSAVAGAQIEATADGR